MSNHVRIKLIQPDSTVKTIHYRDVLDVIEMQSWLRVLTSPGNYASFRKDDIQSFDVSSAETTTMDTFFSTEIDHLEEADTIEPEPSKEI